jgi:hypothetical protein
MNNATIELTEQEMECVNGGDAILVAAIIAGVLGLITWIGGGSGSFNPGAGGGTPSITFSGTWDQFLNGVYRLFGLT